MFFESYPENYIQRIVKPGRLEYFEDAPARALKIKGYSAEGLPCFYFHTYSMSEPRIDCEDEAYELIVYFERVLAWRLDDGHWIQQKIQAQHPVCSLDNQHDPAYEEVENCAWFA